MAAQGYGYLEDRRPSSNCDPYQVSTFLSVDTFLAYKNSGDKSYCGNNLLGHVITGTVFVENMEF